MRKSESRGANGTVYLMPIGLWRAEKTYLRASERQRVSHYFSTKTEAQAWLQKSRPSGELQLDDKDKKR
jgi:hypothetical protein